MIKRSSIRIFFAVQHALFLRELNMRFSAGRMGLFWTFFEPFFQIMIFVLIKLLLFGGSDSDSGFDFAVFLALNFTAFNMFKNIVMTSANSFQANKALFAYKQVKPIDTIIARTMVEVFITGVIIIIFLCIGFYFEFDMQVKDLTMVTLAFILLLFFSVAVAVVVAVLNVFVDSIAKLMGFFMTALMFGSAVFYTIEMIPPEIQVYLLYNPLTHFMEMVHGYYFFTLNDQFVDYQYMTLWTLALMYIGLWLYVKLEKRVISA